MRRPLAILALCLLALALPAGASAQSGALERAATELRRAPVYVDPAAERRIGAADAARVRAAISREDAGPLYIAVLPGRAADEAGGSATAALVQVARDVGEPGTYAGVIGNSFRAGSVGGVLPSGAARQAATEAVESAREGGTTAVLLDFVARVGRERSGAATPAAPRGGGGGAGWLFLLLVVAIPVAALGFLRLRRRGRERADLERVKEFARDDLVALGDDLRALELDVDLTAEDAPAKQEYGRAVEAYTAADEALDTARRPEDVERVASLVEEGRFALTAAKAMLDGRPVPERRPPCFFDPRHGPSTTDVEWAPPGGQPRPVPVCAADAARIADGLEPEARQVAVNGVMTPYWNAGPAYVPWAGGFFGGGLLPGLFVGSMLGGGFGLMGGALAGDAWADQGGFGGGDLGGGGDFGGGDFGGG